MKKKLSLTTLSRRRKLRVAGLMSGTSADGVDVALADITDDRVTVRAFDTFPYPQALRRRVLELGEGHACTAADICHWNVVIGEIFAESFLKLCTNSRIDPQTVHLIGSHGQTIHHNPQGARFGRRLIRSTLQIGEPAVIAHRAGITTVADFRPRDIAAGGQGAPLVPFADYVLFRHRQRSRAIQNIGGIANVTYLPAACQPHDIIAFDTGPGNMIMDRFMTALTDGKKKYDRNGKLAASGSVDQTLLKHMLRHPFLKRRPPKSTGREEFGQEYCDTLYTTAQKQSISSADLIATATAFTAVTIAQAYRRFLPQLPDDVILCGGGAHNHTLLTMLQQELPESQILISDKFGISTDAKEAVSFAILAYAAIKGIPNNIPTATGADHPLVLGKITPA